MIDVSRTCLKLSLYHNYLNKSKQNIQFDSFKYEEIEFFNDLLKCLLPLWNCND